jgi:hypothetical protein
VHVRVVVVRVVRVVRVVMVRVVPVPPVEELPPGLAVVVLGRAQPVLAEGAWPILAKRTRFTCAVTRLGGQPASALLSDAAEAARLAALQAVRSWREHPW